MAGVYERSTGFENNATGVWMSATETRAADAASIEKGVVEILEEMTREWDTEFSGKIGPETRLMQDLTMESIDIVMLIVAIEEKFGKKGLPFDTLLMEEGRYVEELKVSQIADFLKANLSAATPA